MSACLVLIAGALSIDKKGRWLRQEGILLQSGDNTCRISSKLHYIAEPGQKSAVSSVKAI
jgi:hypothetical protein